MMKYTTLGRNGIKVSRLGLGCMGMSAFYTGAGADDARLRVDDGVHARRVLQDGAVA